MNNPEEKEEFDVGEVDMTDPIYQLWITCENEEHESVELPNLIGEFQYLDDANGALDVVKNEIGDIYSSFKERDNRIKIIVIELDMTVGDEFVENVERTIYEF